MSLSRANTLGVEDGSHSGMIFKNPCLFSVNCVPLQGEFEIDVSERK